MNLLTLIEGLKQLKETVIILLVIYPSERIPVQVLKQFLAEVSKSFMAITDLYERERRFKDEKTEILLKQTRLRGQERRAQRVQKEM